MIKIELKQIKDNLYKLIWLSESLSLSLSLSLLFSFKCMFLFLNIYI